MRLDALCNVVRESIAVDGEGRTRRHATGRGCLHNQGIAAAQFFFQEIGCGSRFIRLERVRADDLSEFVGAMRRRRSHGAHFIQTYGHAVVRRLPGSFDACQSAANDNDIAHVSVCGFAA